MPLFTNNSDADSRGSHALNDTSNTPTRKGSIFSRTSRSPDTTSTTTTSTRRSGFFRRSSSDETAHKDPHILNARRKVADAEAAESAADRALIAARKAVKEAREHVKRLEREAEEQ